MFCQWQTVIKVSLSDLSEIWTAAFEKKKTMHFLIKGILNNFGYSC